MARLKQVALKTQKAPRKVARLGSKAPSKKVPTATKVTAAPQQEGEKKKRRWRPGTVATRMFFRYQKAVARGGMVVPRAPFQDMVRQVMGNLKFGVRYTEDAMEKIQEAAQNRVYEVLNMAGGNARFYGRKTLRVEDIDRAIAILQKV